jgi:hypothetical protein
VEGDVLEGRLINIKGDDIIATYRSVFYSITNGVCYLTIEDEPRYNFLRVEGDSLAVQILSKDRKAVREWVKITEGAK